MQPITFSTTDKKQSQGIRFRTNIRHDGYNYSFCGSFSELIDAIKCLGG